MMVKTAMISGHLDLTQEEFDEHYKPLIIHAIEHDHDFVVGDARGADAMAQLCLKEWIDKLHALSLVRVYHMFTAPRHNAGFDTKSGFTKDDGKDAAMTKDSDYDIAWVRPSKHSSESGRVSGTEQNIIRRKAKGQS
jgi:hypothetical protein